MIELNQGRGDVNFLPLGVNAVFLLGELPVKKLEVKPPVELIDLP